MKGWDWWERTPTNLAQFGRSMRDIQIVRGSSGYVLTSLIPSLVFNTRSSTLAKWFFWVFHNNSSDPLLTEWNFTFRSIILSHSSLMNWRFILMIQSGYCTSLSMIGYEVTSCRLFLQFKRASSSNFVVDGGVTFDVCWVLAFEAFCVAVPEGLVFHFLKSLFYPIDRIFC